jgi:4-hydroxybenzoate polyprenyltransferase
VISRLIEISRPVLWVNTIGTTVIGMWLSGYLWTWEILPILIWVTFPFNLALGLPLYFAIAKLAFGGPP